MNDLLSTGELLGPGNALKLEPPPPPVVNPATIESGAIIKHYEIIRRLGAGGMGTVFLARDIRLGRLVAIKFLNERSGTAVGRFLVEARTTAQCRHENIVVIYDVDEIGGRPYMVLEYVSGRTLRDVMSGQTRDTATMAVELMLPVAQALDCAHHMGIVHRDLKPENIFLSDAGQIKVLDFGIAKHMTRAEVDTMTTQPMGQMPNQQLTQESAFGGTIPYMSPEQWLEEPIDGRTDIWALGIILFELATGTHPLHPLSPEELYTISNMNVPMPGARDKLPNALALADVIDRCLKKRKEERFASATELADALEKLTTHHRTKSLSHDESPFAGLSAFQEADADRFFGRDDDIAAVVAKLRHQQLIAIAGPSGAGKSSFVRAGVFPALKRASRELETFVVRPGRQPLAALADVLAFLVDTAGGDEESDRAAITEILRTQPGYLGAKLRTRCRKRGNDHRILLFVDPWEELYTQGIAAEERAAFCACIEGVADDPSSPLRVMLAIRADFLDRLSEDRQFLAAVTRGLVILPPMTADGLRNAVQKPLDTVGYRFDDQSLVHEMVVGLEGAKSPLPLLQFAATKLWEARDKEQKLLLRSAYQALGGVAGALSTHADAVLGGMSVVEQRIARSIFLRLVTPERTRAVVHLDELGGLGEDMAKVEQVVQRLAEARLVSIEAGGEREGNTVELTHESLVDRWAKLRQWLDADEQDLQFLVELRNAAQQWEKNGRADDFLWRDRAALEAGQWLERRKAEDLGGLGKRERGYLEAVVRLAQRTRRRQRRMIGALFAGLGVVTLIILVLLFRANREAAHAAAERDAAQQSSLRARNATRMAAARERQLVDPTTALALLREIEPGSVPHGWAEVGEWAQRAVVAEVVLHHDAEVYWAAFSPDGQRIASASAGDVLVWSASGEGPPVVLKGHDKTVQWVAWSPDGRHIASTSEDKTVRVWRSVDGEGQAVVLEGHGDTVFVAAWSPDGKHIVTPSWDRTVRVWNADGTGQPIVLQGHGSAVRAAAFSPDGQRIVSASNDKTVRVWNADGTGQPIVLEGHDGFVRSAVFSPDGQRIVSASWDKTVRVWNADGTGQPVVFKGHDGAVNTAAWSPDGQRIVSASHDTTVRVWNADGTGQPIVLKHGHRVASAAFSRDGQRIVSASWDKTVRVWRVGRNSQINVLQGHDEVVSSAAFSPDGQRVVSTSWDKTVRVWNADGTGQPIVLEDSDVPVCAASWSPDGKRIASASVYRTVRVWNADGTGQPIVLQGHDGSVYTAAWSPDGQRIVSAAHDMTVRVWNADGTGQPIVLQGHAGAVHGAAFSPDGQRIVSASADMTVRVWNADGTGQPRVFQGHDSIVYKAAWSPDGQRIVSASADMTVRVWNADGTGQPITLQGQHGIPHAAAFSPDGQRILSASNDGAVRIWNANGTGEPIVLRASKMALTSASWSPDGKRIVMSSDDKTVIIWSDLAPLRNADDPQLWTTQYCMPLDIRRQLLDFPEDQSRTDLERCQRRVAEARSMLPGW